MTEEKIISVVSRPPTEAEQDVAAWFEKQEGQSVETLEAAARQIIALVTTFFGLVFGLLALGSDKFAAGLQAPGAIRLGGAAVGLLLLALGAALAVVWPRRYTYRESGLDQMRAVYQAIVAAKSGWLQIALILFGLGLAAFAGLILLLLLGRLP